jgi:hypothetical protein
MFSALSNTRKPWKEVMITVFKECFHGRQTTVKLQDSPLTYLKAHSALEKCFICRDLDIGAEALV